MRKPVQVLAEGLGHPEGPCVLPDGRVAFANTYNSEIAVWDPARGTSRYGFTGGGPNACMLGTDGYLYCLSLIHIFPSGNVLGGQLRPQRDVAHEYVAKYFGKRFIKSRLSHRVGLPSRR